jgi:hypothetical protein
MRRPIPPRKDMSDGGLVYRTEDCDVCDFYRTIKGQDLCGVEPSFKYIVEGKELKKCERMNMEIISNLTRSIEYLDELLPRQGGV